MLRGELRIQTLPILLNSRDREGLPEGWELSDQGYDDPISHVSPAQHADLSGWKALPREKLEDRRKLIKCLRTGQTVPHSARAPSARPSPVNAVDAQSPLLLLLSGKEARLF